MAGEGSQELSRINEAGKRPETSLDSRLDACSQQLGGIAEENAIYDHHAGFDTIRSEGNDHGWVEGVLVGMRFGRGEIGDESIIRRLERIEGELRTEK